MIQISRIFILMSQTGITFGHEKNGKQKIIMTTRQATRLLFLCPDNSTYSPIAAAWAEALGGRCVQSRSAGLQECRSNQSAKEVMREAGINIAHRPRPVNDSLMDWADLIIAYSDQPIDEMPVPPGLKLLTHKVPAMPKTINAEETRIVRDRLYIQIRRLITSISEKNRRTETTTLTAS